MNTSSVREIGTVRVGLQNKKVEKAGQVPKEGGKNTGTITEGTPPPPSQTKKIPEGGKKPPPPSQTGNIPEGGKKSPPPSRTGNIPEGGKKPPPPPHQTGKIPEGGQKPPPHQTGKIPEGGKQYETWRPKKGTITEGGPPPERKKGNIMEMLQSRQVLKEGTITEETGKIPEGGKKYETWKPKKGAITEGGPPPEK